MAKKLLVMAALVIGVVLAVAGCTTASANTESLWLADYQTGYETLNESASTAATVTFIGSSSSRVYHYPWCSYVSRIKTENRVSFATAAAAEAQGYRPCTSCHPPQ